MDMHATAAKAADNFPLQQSGTFSGRPGIAPEAEGLRGGAQPLQVVFVFLPGNVPWMRVANQHLPSATARWRSAYWRSVLSVFSNTCRMVDWRTYR